MRTPLSFIPVALVTTAVVLGNSSLTWAEPSTTSAAVTNMAATDLAEIPPRAASLSAAEIDQQVLTLLSAGDQSGAENLLSQQLATMSESLHLTKLLAESENREAGRYFAAHRDALRKQQRALFLAAALNRSRFDKQGSLLLFNAVYAVDPDTSAGQCALCMLELDTTRRSVAGVIAVGQALQELRKVVAAHPDDVIVRWMLAVQFRTWNQNKEGAEQYRQILERWNPGPALVHQTYANLLDKLGRYQEALKHRYVTVRMEPASWSFDGLGNTLDSLERFQEGCAAHWIAVRMNPLSASHLSNWGFSLCGNKQYDAAIERCQQALELEPTFFRASWVWGKALAGKGDLKGALAKYDQALSLYPGETTMRQEAKLLRERISKGELTGTRSDDSGGL